MSEKQALCPCGTGNPYKTCCGQYIEGKETVPTAEALMRSRYSAYVVGDIDYIVATMVDSDPAHFDRPNAEEWSKNSEWLGFELIAQTPGKTEEDPDIIEFAANYKYNDKTLRLHEISQFKKIDGRWMYVDGEIQHPGPYVRETPKIGRNDSCPCGSGKKYKKCCQPVNV